MDSAFAVFAIAAFDRTHRVEVQHTPQSRFEGILGAVDQTITDRADLVF
jgi:hypothetical protein